ncbi:MAG TPA: hypothetical protein VHL34_11955, partial [Rhizomicrobium sp.]|nr:hypothetical protein [Rhizomicrobium sp.]
AWNPKEKNSMKTAYSFPHEVVQDPSLGTEQKRALLAEWASDACAVDSLPTLRWRPGTPFPVTLSSIMDARRQLDRSVAYVDESDNAEAARCTVIDFAKRRRFENRA